MSRQSSHRHPADSTHGQDGGIGRLDEVLAAIGTEIARCASRANDLARLIESTGSLAFNMTAETYRDEAKPCIRGMRVTVGTIMGLLASGQSEDQILAAYPYLEPEDVRAALAYAAWRTQETELPLP